MKYLFLLLLFAVATPSLSAQNKALRKFIQEHRKGEENVAFTVPGFLVGLASEIGMLASEEEEEKLAFQLAQEFGTIRVLTFQTGDFNTKRDINKLLNTLESEHDYERWASVRGPEGEEVQLSVVFRKEEIREILTIVSHPDEDRTFLVHARTDLTAEELGDIINKIIAED